MSTFANLRAAASPALRDWMDRHADHVAEVIGDLPTGGARNVTDQHLEDLHRGVGRARVGAPGRKLVRVEWDRRIDAEMVKLEALDNAELAQLVDREVIAVVNARSGVLSRAGAKREALERVFQQRTGHSLYASAEGMVEAARRLHPRAPARRTERDTLIAEIRTLGETGRTLVDAERFKWKVADLSGLLPTEQQLASTMRSLDDLREWRDELRAAIDAYTAKHKATAPVVKVEAPSRIRIPLTGAAASEIEIRAEDPDLGDLDDPDVRAVLRAWDGDALVFDREAHETIRRGLVTLSSALEDMVEDLKRAGSSDEAHAARQASARLATAAQRVQKAAPPLYRYGARNRPIDFATVPKGYVSVEPRTSWVRTRHGVVVYDRPLTDDEVQRYELTPYMDPGTLVKKLFTKLKHEKEYAAAIRKKGNTILDSRLMSEIAELNVYTDVPFAEITRRVADRLLAAYPAP